MRRKMFTFTQLAALTICCAVPFANQLRSEDSDRIGKRIANFSLKNQFGKEYSLQEFGDSEV
ncbi:MAG TPA: hypothetical protein DCF63_07735, partial [Planctomycetaceae bacterium]|nr:hypothetical protein [Planctomycetaceae bacterium]